LVGIEAVTFDFWQTIVTEQEGAFDYYRARRKELLIEALRTVDDLKEERLEEALHAEARDHNRIWLHEHRTLTAGERLRRVLKLLRVKLPEEVTVDLTRAFETGILERPPVLVEGARELVQALAGRYRLGIISDTGFSPGVVLREVLRANRLLDAFDSLVFSDEAGRSKPHFEVFSRSSEALGTPLAGIVHIGDLEHTDVLGAKNAGCRAIRFTGITPLNGGETQADFVTACLNDVPHLINVMG
jgi:putative hydrolase of the HAD superfamily